MLGGTGDGDGRIRSAEGRIPGSQKGNRESNDRTGAT